MRILALTCSSNLGGRDGLVDGWGFTGISLRAKGREVRIFEREEAGGSRSALRANWIRQINVGDRENQAPN
jgi:hypothetical protein